MELQLIEVFVKISFCCELFEGFIGDFDLTIDPRMLEFGELVLNGMLLFTSHHITSHQRRCVFWPQVLRKQFIGKLRPIVCENFRYFFVILKGQWAIRFFKNAIDSLIDIFEWSST
ncbi:hypothetical protein P618_200571 [Holospora obtusa F1]|uniref:Uncharacterized protein n=2 Tax=Holospora obtusa TaxID=49893 RepID=W6TTW7_HOLOB|nr:hypothetical protein P618_200571 [Holospora obtusa F1]